MPKSKPGAFPDEAVIDVKADHSVITPKKNLKSFARKAKEAAEDVEAEIVAKAEAALSELSGEFGDWLRQETERLTAAGREAERFGWSEPAREALYGVAHDMRGQAATLGCPAAGIVADGLCRLLEIMAGAATPSREIEALAAKHVEAVGAIVREQGGPKAEATAEALAAALAAAVARHAPEVTNAPPLAPG